MMTPQNSIQMKTGEFSILFYGTHADRSYLHYLKPLIGKHKCFVHTNTVNTLYEIESYCRERNITAVITTSPTLLKKLSGRDNPKIDNFAGSHFSRSGIEYVIVDPLEQCVTVPYGKFLLERFTSKITAPAKWLKTPEFKWRIIKTQDRKSTRLNSSHSAKSRMPSSA